MSVPADTPIVTSAAIRAAELAMTAEGVSLSVLMERAGAALADMVWRAAAGRSALILCGPGNNGGDGYVAARLLAARGLDVRVAASAPPATELAQNAAQTWTGPVEPLVAATAAAPILVDALFGVGLTRPLAPELAANLGRLALAAERRIAVDVPSGVASDSGAVLSPTPMFDLTLALGALKPAHVLFPAAALCGTVQCAPIGIKLASPMHSLARFSPRIPAADSHKYSRGQVLVIAGPMAGAAELAATAALRAGAGHALLQGGDARQCAAVVAVQGALADRLRDRRIGAVVIGPGSAQGAALDAHVTVVIAAGKPVVLDAAAIEAGLPALKSAGMMPPATIMTPHAGEFDRVFGSSSANKIDRTRAAARATEAVIIHKGADTIIAAPDGRIAAGWPGSPWLATAGTGDVLAGACGAMLAAGYDAFTAACRAVGWHQAAARRVGPGLIADDLVARP